MIYIIGYIVGMFLYVYVLGKLSKFMDFDSEDIDNNIIPRTLIWPITIITLLILLTFKLSKPKEKEDEN